MFSSLMNMILQAAKTFGDLLVIWSTVCLGLINRPIKDEVMIHVFILLAFGAYLGTSGVIGRGGTSKVVGWWSRAKKAWGMGDGIIMRVCTYRLPASNRQILTSNDCCYSGIMFH